MQKRLVTAVWLVALPLLALTSCVTPPSRTPERAAAPAAIAEPPNLFLLKKDLLAYIDDGRYDAGVARVTADAKAWIEQRSAQGGKLAIVLDIDETALSNLRHMREMDFGYVPALWDHWVALGDGPAIAPMLDLFRMAKERGIAVFFLTGRKTTDAPGTLKNLQDSGYAGYTEVYFKPPGYPSTQAFKTAMRQKISGEGYTIIANVGDQQSDLDGGYSERAFKLPNPFYITK